MSRHATVRRIHHAVEVANTSGGESEVERIAARLLGRGRRGTLAFGSKEVDRAADRKPVTIRRFSWEEK